MTLHRYKPYFAYHFGIRPWEVQRLSWAEFELFCDFVDQLNTRLNTKQ